MKDGWWDGADPKESKMKRDSSVRESKLRDSSLRESKVKRDSSV